MTFQKKRIYLDNTATTRTRSEVVVEMKKYYDTIYANPSSIHEDGIIARGSIEMARERISAVINCDSEEIVFCGSGSEANNLAVIGCVKFNGRKGCGIVTTKIEHKSVLNAFKSLEDEYRVTYAGVEHDGSIDRKELECSISHDTVFASIGYMNNEIGNVHDIKELICIVRNKNPRVIIHVDAVQALPYFKIDLAKIDADLMSFSGHKLYAPKGIGFLFVRKNTGINPLIYGGEQEFGLRSGTENVPYIVGLSKAVQLNDKEKQSYIKKLSVIRDYLISEITSIPDIVLTGAMDRSPNHASFCIKGLNGKMLVKELSLKGFDVSSGSACSSPKNDPSHVLEACGIDKDYLHGGLRITLGKYNKMSDAVRLVRCLKDTVRMMREKSHEYYNEGIFISKAEMIRKMVNNENILIIDVRPFRFPRLKIDNSINIPAYAIKSNLKKIDRSKEIILVCYQGDILSPLVHQELVRNGFKNAKVLKGGLLNFYGLSF
jgi:cysteine desulfurase